MFGLNLKPQQEKNVVLANEYVKRMCGYTRKSKDTNIMI